MSVRISIITISYNSGKTIEKTIQSVISQNYDNLEYIIIDGGSSDETMDIVNKYKESISYVVSEPDKGISDAFNKGIKASTGEIIGIINSDDLLLPNALETINESYSECIDVYVGGLRIFNPVSMNVDIAYPSTVYSVNSRAMIVCHPSTFITRSSYKKFGVYKTDFRYMMDSDLLIRLSQGGARFKKIDTVLAQFTCGGVTDNVNLKKSMKEYSMMLLDNGASRKVMYLFVVRAFVYALIKNICVKFGIWEKMRKYKYKNSDTIDMLF